MKKIQLKKLVLTNESKLNADEKRKVTGGGLACSAPNTYPCSCYYNGRWHEYCCGPGGCEAGIPQI